MWYRQCLSRVFEPVVQLYMAKIMVLEFLGIRVSNFDGGKQKVKTLSPSLLSIKAVRCVLTVVLECHMQGVQSCFLPYWIGAHMHAAGQQCWQYPGNTWTPFWLCKNWLVYRAFQEQRKSLNKLGQKLGFSLTQLLSGVAIPPVLGKSAFLFD